MHETCSTKRLNQNPTPESFSAMIKRHSAVNGTHEERSLLALFLQKLRCPTSSSFRLDHLSLVAVFKSCAAIAAIKLGESLHGYVAKLGHLSCLSVSKAVLNVYAKCGALDDCQKLFREMGHRDSVVWNIVLSGFSGSLTRDAQVLKLVHEMHVGHEPKPNSITAAVVLPVCARSRDLYAGKSVHSYVIKSGLESETLVGNALLSMYAKCGLAHTDAYTAFSNIDHKDVVSWNAMIAGFAENKCIEDALKIFCWMLNGPIEPNSATIANILPMCASLDKNAACHFGKEIHCYALQRSALAADVSVCNALMSFYLRIGCMREAESLFRNMLSKDIISWNAVVAGYSSNGACAKALDLFSELISLGPFGPDRVTLISILPACAEKHDLRTGKMIHGYILRRPELHEDTAVSNALISFYSSCNDVTAALRTFSIILKRDLISWNAILDTFADSGDESEFVDLLQKMFNDGVSPDVITVSSMISVFSSGSRINKIKEIHSYSTKAGFFLSDVEPPLCNRMLDAYAKCGSMDYTKKLFKIFSGRNSDIISSCMVSDLCDDAYAPIQMNIVTWNLMIRIYAESNCLAEALELFHDLQVHRTKPDAVTVMSILPLCAQMAFIQALRQLHGYVVRACFEDLHLKAGLLDGYSKCGTLNYACALFQSTPYKDLVMYTAMISGYAMHGMGEDALRTYYYVLETGLRPDHVIFTAVLSACSHSGLLDEGWKIFNSIEKIHRIEPTMEQYACVVDLLARGGRVKDAYSFVTRMPVEANANVWGALLGACKTHHEVELGRVVADRLFDVEASDIGNYVVMSNLYASEARWDGVLEMRKLMRTKDLKKPPGCSWIELEGNNHFFIAGDSYHPVRSDIYSALCTLNQQVKEIFGLYEVD